MDKELEVVMQTESGCVELSDVNNKIAGLAGKLIEAVLQSETARDPRRMEFLEWVRARDGLNLALAAVIPADDPASVLLEVALCRPADGVPVARIIRVVAMMGDRTCDFH